MKILYSIIFTIILFLSLSVSVYAKGTVDTTAIDGAGYSLLEVLQAIGKWLVILKGIYDVIKCAINHDKAKLGDVITTYMIIATAMYGIPAIINMIQSFFG